MALVRAFISGVRYNRELDSDLTEATLTLNALGPRYEAVSLAIPSLPVYVHEAGVSSPFVNSHDEIERSNIFILIVASELTATVEREFNVAQALGLPCQMFARAGSRRSPGLQQFLDRSPTPVVEYQDRGELSVAVRQFAFLFVEAESERELVLGLNRHVWLTIIRELSREPDRVFSLGDRGFEELIAELVAAQGYDVRLTPQTRDGGYDIVATRRERLFPSTYLIEAKLWTPPRRVGRPVIQSLFGVGIAHRCNGVMVVTPTLFTRVALEFVGVENLTDFVRLVDGKELPEWYRAYQPR
jgi:hypothetical protein